MTDQDMAQELGDPLPPDTPQSGPLPTGLTLRQQAEKILREQEDLCLEELEAMEPQKIRALLHELRVHQIELEMQNVELRRAQVEIVAAKDRYFQLYDLAPVGYCTMNEKGMILEANLTLASLLGVDRGTLVRQPLNRYIHKEDQDMYYLHRQQLLKTGVPQVCELRMVKNTGAQLWARLNGNAAQLEDGVRACRVALSDITEYKRLVEERGKLEAQFQQAQKMESVGRLAGGVAHDFNNKLTIILGYVELIMAKMGPDHSIYAKLQEIRNAAQHSAVLTRQLLTFARKQAVIPRILDLNETVVGLLRMLQRLIGEDISLSWLPAIGLWPVKMDPSQIDQILANLCVNARDAIPGVGELTIATANIVLDDTSCAAIPGCVPGEYVLLAVSDNGCGMDRDTLANIFEPFFTTKELGRGTGLGLATVYGAVKQNAGFIYADSVPDSGTTFKIYLPRYTNTCMPTIRKENPEEPVLPGTETILIVEDEPAIMAMITLILQALGYAVLAADSPTEALRLAREFAGQIDLLVTDMIMPGMNGRDLADELVSCSPQLKTLFMSGYSFGVLSQQGRIDSDVHFLQKPFSKSELATKVREALMANGEG